MRIRIAAGVWTNVSADPRVSALGSHVSVIADTNDAQVAVGVNTPASGYALTKGTAAEIATIESEASSLWFFSTGGCRVEFNKAGSTVILSNADHEANGGQEFTGGFTDRLVGQTGASDFGTSVAYTQAEVDAGSWRRFGIDVTARDANDITYWADAEPTKGKGLFGGTQMPAGVYSMFDYTDTSISAAVTTGGLKYSAASGSLDWTDCKVGDQAMVRFGFNIIPQVANTTVEVGLIFATRDPNDAVTFTFPLTTTPLFYGAGSVGKSFLNRPIMTAYFASAEDINARALPAIRSDNPVLIQPLSMLTTIVR